MSKSLQSNDCGKRHDIVISFHWKRNNCRGKQQRKANKICRSNAITKKGEKKKTLLHPTCNITECSEKKIAVWSSCIGAYFTMESSRLHAQLKNCVLIGQSLTTYFCCFMWIYCGILYVKPLMDGMWEAVSVTVSHLLVGSIQGQEKHLCWHH